MPHPPSVGCSVAASVTRNAAHMPVTAKLSKQFYDRLGEDIANELVEWFNAVDATYRARSP